MDRNRWLIFSGLCIALIAGLVIFASKDKVDVSTVDGAKINTTSDIADHVIGNPNAKTVVIEYADYQCPGCKAAFPQIKSISDQYKEHVAFVFRNFPLTTGHQHAFAAAATSEAAGLQGKYWEMHDLLYQNQDAWHLMTAEQRDTAFAGYGSELGLNIDRFKTDLSSKQVAAKINADRALGLKMGVDSTPTFFLNGKKVASAIVSDVMEKSGDMLRDALDDAIKQDGKTPPSR